VLSRGVINTNRDSAGFFPSGVIFSAGGSTAAVIDGCTIRDVRCTSSTGPGAELSGVYVNNNGSPAVEFERPIIDGVTVESRNTGMAIIASNADGSSIRGCTAKGTLAGVGLGGTNSKASDCTSVALDILGGAVDAQISNCRVTGAFTDSGTGTSTSNLVIG
jgi:hypothetical protein